MVTSEGWKAFFQKKILGAEKSNEFFTKGKAGCETAFAEWKHPAFQGLFSRKPHGHAHKACRAREGMVQGEQRENNVLHRKIGKGERSAGEKNADVAQKLRTIALEGQKRGTEGLCRKRSGADEPGRKDVREQKRSAGSGKFRGGRTKKAPDIRGFSSGSHENCRRSGHGIRQPHKRPPARVPSHATK